MLNILVCVKQVPDVNLVKIDPVTGSLIRKGVPAILNPLDANALEAAVRTKEKYGGKVTWKCNNACGENGSNVTWSLDASDTLTMTGKGATEVLKWVPDDYSYFAFRDEIRSIVGKCYERINVCGWRKCIK